jgi:CheY-like chemotaxis protein
VSRRILLVEDHPTMRGAMRLILAGHDWSIEESADGREALRTILRDPPDLVLMDLHMPGMHGTDLLRAVREDPVAAHVHVVVVTASGDEDRADAIRAGGVAYFTKPFEPASLLETVRSLLGSEGATG